MFNDIFPVLRRQWHSAIAAAGGVPDLPCTSVVVRCGTQRAANTTGLQTDGNHGEHGQHLRLIQNLTQHLTP